MKRRTIVTATSFTLLILLTTCISSGAHAQSQPTAGGISALSHVLKVAHVRVDGGPNTTSSGSAYWGPPGPRGPQGPRGVAGPRGPQGVAGSGGAPGVPGVPGQAGQPGSIGNAGPAGDAGPTGPTGPAGGPGAQGVTGSTGVVGIPGPSPSDIANYGSAPIVSSNAPGSTGSMATDFDLTTAWASAINDPTPTITLNMGSVYPISAVQLYWGDATPRTFHLETCADITATAVRANTQRHVGPNGIRPNTPPGQSCEPTGSQTAAPWTPIPGTSYTNDTSLGNFITFPKFSTQYIRLVGTNTDSTSYVLREFQVLSTEWW